jgi:hypothetical protein
MMHGLFGVVAVHASVCERMRACGSACGRVGAHADNKCKCQRGSAASAGRQNSKKETQWRVMEPSTTNLPIYLENRFSNFFTRAFSCLELRTEPSWTRLQYSNGGYLPCMYQYLDDSHTKLGSGCPRGLNVNKITRLDMVLK